VRDQVVTTISSATPGGISLATTVITVLGAIALTLFVLFFLLKDGDGMWQWVVHTAPARHRDRIEEAGQRGWDTASRYVVGVVIIAVADSVLIGAGLFAVGVPVALSLSVLVFFGAFVPVLGALISGAVAVAVALVTNGTVAALIVLAIVLIVQNVEGNLLQPLVQGRAVHLHPVVIIVVVTAGYLLFGIAGAVVAVPLVAVTYTAARSLRDRESVPKDPPLQGNTPFPPPETRQ
jgi:predicted PurR-regulated permease PerM